MAAFSGPTIANERKTYSSVNSTLCFRMLDEQWEGRLVDKERKRGDFGPAVHRPERSDLRTRPTLSRHNCATNTFGSLECGYKM